MKSENISQCERNSAHNVGNKSKRRRLLGPQDNCTPRTNGPHHIGPGGQVVSDIFLMFSAFRMHIMLLKITARVNTELRMISS